MDLAKGFEICSGTVIGAEHIGSGGLLGAGSNQDAFAIKATPSCIAAVVCDGCSDRQQSAVGASLLARLFVKHALQLGASASHMKVQTFVGKLNSALTQGMVEVAEQLVPAKSEIRTVVDELFLVTVVGAVILPSHTLVVAAGDGMWGLNGTINTIGPFPKNEPPYLAYQIRDGRGEEAELQCVGTCPTNDLQTLFLGSDGCSYLPETELRQFWREERFFKNPALISRELRTRNQENFSFATERNGVELVIRPHWTERSLADDTTLIAVRRKPLPPPPPPVFKPAAATKKESRPPRRSRGLFSHLWGAEDSEPAKDSDPPKLSKGGSSVKDPNGLWEKR